VTAAVRVAALTCATAFVALPLSAQVPALWLRGDTEESRRIEVVAHNGYAAVDSEVFRSLGWSIAVEADTLALLSSEGMRVGLVVDDPFFRWQGEVLQLADPLYREGGRIFVPVQLLVDFVPDRLEAFTFDPVARVLTYGRGPSLGADYAGARGPQSRVIVIDAGHGGSDQGAVGRSGVREKDVALSVARALADELGRDSSLVVHLTRDRDVFIPVWRRGEQATRWRGEQPGVFISLHANALPGSRATRGFETYFLSEARTDHERRVAAIENAASSGPGEPDGRLPDPELDLILNELRTLDHQHWSALLAELVQQELGAAHDGPDRGVKQAPFAVITNALMPAVLIELGFLTNSEDERLLSRPEFHERVALGIAQAVRLFLDRYAPDEDSAREPSR
jgi:N-acetylmuramoyl-L-alanine amidase